MLISLGRCCLGKVNLLVASGLSRLGGAAERGELPASLPQLPPATQKNPPPFIASLLLLCCRKQCCAFFPFQGFFCRYYKSGAATTIITVIFTRFYLRSLAVARFD
jgi:hypothetical protein